MRYCTIISLFLALTFAGGCVTSTVTCRMEVAPKEKIKSGKQVVAQLDGMNSGVFLFYYIPLWSGKDTRPNRREYKTFRNLVGQKNMKRMLEMYSRKFLKADAVENISCEEKSSGVWTLWILWKRSIHGTGTAVKYKK